MGLFKPRCSLFTLRAPCVSLWNRGKTNNAAELPLCMTVWKSWTEGLFCGSFEERSGRSSSRCTLSRSAGARWVVEKWEWRRRFFVLSLWISTACCQTLLSGSLTQPFLYILCTLEYSSNSVWIKLHWMIILILSLVFHDELIVVCYYG